MKLNLFIAAVLSAALCARAHMGLTPTEAQIGESAIVTLRIGHDCGDDTIGTTNFTIELPPRLAYVSVEQSPNWRTIIHKAEAKPPMPGPVHEYIRAVTYLGFLPDDYYQLFNLRIRMPETPGEMLWFSGYQDCHNQGTSIAWNVIPNDENPDPRYPARGIVLVNHTLPVSH